MNAWNEVSRSHFLWPTTTTTTTTTTKIPLSDNVVLCKFNFGAISTQIIYGIQVLHFKHLKLKELLILFILMWCPITKWIFRQLSFEKNNYRYLHAALFLGNCQSFETHFTTTYLKCWISHQHSQANQDSQNILWWNSLYPFSKNPSKPIIITCIVTHRKTLPQSKLGEPESSSVLVPAQYFQFL